MRPTLVVFALLVAALSPAFEAGSTLDTLDENTLELYGVSVGVTVRF